MYLCIISTGFTERHCVIPAHFKECRTNFKTVQHYTPPKSIKTISVLHLWPPILFQKRPYPTKIRWGPIP